MPASAQLQILVLRTDRLGDVILSTPVAAALKKQFPDAHITFLVREYTRAICDMCPHIDEVVTLEQVAPGSAWQRLYRLISFLRERRFDIAIHLFPRPDLALATFCARLPIRIGTGFRGYSVLFNRRHFEHRKSATFHEAEFNLHLLRHLGIDEAQPAFSLRTNKGARQRVRSLLEEHGVRPETSLVILHPGSGGSARDWPLASFAALARRLRHELDATVVVTGNGDESAVVERLLISRDVKLFSLAGRLSIQELAALLQRAKVVVANSTGPLHLAVAAGTRVVAFYPPIRPCRPERWGPFGQRGNVLMSQDEECVRCKKLQGGSCACMAAISVETTLAKIKALLSTEAEKQTIYDSRMLS